MPKFYFIAGASGSGKSTIIPDLKKILGQGYVVHDFDSIGVPPDADKKWRQETTEKWLNKMLQENKNVCLLGQIVLGEILACPSAKKIENVNFCLLDVDDYERIKRLKNRNVNDANQNMLNWSSWLRMHHQDPQWEQHVLKADCWHGLNFSEWDRLKSWNIKATVKIIDTTDLSIQNSGEALAQWIIEDDKYAEHILDNEYVIQNSTNEDYHNIFSKFQYYDQENVPYTQNPPRIEKNYVITYQGNAIAGIYADIYHWKILYICILYVDQKHRNKNLGSILLQKVEDEARKMGSKISHLETYDFQSKDFYLKHGYEIFGVFENCPEGHKRYYLKKIL